MTMDSNMIPKLKNNMAKSINENSNEVLEKEIPPPSMNSLEKLLSTYKLKQVNHCAVGYSKIAGQVYRRSVKAGFQFNLMIVGCSGLGKSSFLNTLFHSQFPENSKTCPVTENTFRLLENDVELTIKVIEVPKFGDKLNNSKCWKKVDNYLETCFEKQVNIESRVHRSETDLHIDPLVHACLYFIQPRSDKSCLNEVDLEFLKNIHNKINIIPIIAKADTMNPHELEINKFNLISELQTHSINYFKFHVPDESGWRAESNSIRLPDRKFIQTLIDRFPFAVVSGCETVLNDKEHILVRTYPWGRIEVDNLAHCDTSALRTLLLSTHMEELKKTTYKVVYENYRIERLERLCGQLGIASENQYHPSIYLEKYFKMMNLSLTKKIDEMESGFQELVQKRELALERKSKELEEISHLMSNELNQSLFDFDKDFTRFIAEKTQWDCDNIEYHETYGTLKVTRNGRLKQISKFKK